MFPNALLKCPWSTVMVDMCQVYPEVFHHLLCCLKVGARGGRMVCLRRVMGEATLWFVMSGWGRVGTEVGEEGWEQKWVG